MEIIITNCKKAVAVLCARGRTEQMPPSGLHSSTIFFVIHNIHNVAKLRLVAHELYRHEDTVECKFTDFYVSCPQSNQYAMLLSF